MTPDQYKATRKAIGLKQHELAERLGLSRVTVCNRENGTSAISKEADLALVMIAAVAEFESQLVQSQPPRVKESLGCGRAFGFASSPHLAACQLFGMVPKINATNLQYDADAENVLAHSQKGRERGPTNTQD